MLGVLYLIAILFFYETVEMTSDDGIWNGLSLNLANWQGIEWRIFGSLSGYFHTSFAAYITAIPLFIYKSHLSIILFLNFLVLIAHFFVIKIGKILINEETGITLSLIFFFSPTMFVFYAFKSWQVFYLPIFQVISFYFFLSFLNTTKRRDLCWSMIFLAFLPHFHLSGILLIPLFLILLIIFKNNIKLKAHDFYLSITILYLINLSILYFLPLATNLITFASMLLFVAAFHFELVSKKLFLLFKQRKTYFVILLFSFVLPYLIHSNLNAFTPLRMFFDLIPGNNKYIAEHIAESVPFTTKFLSLECLLIFSFFLFFKIRTIKEITIYFIMTYIFASIAFLSVFINEKSIPHQWFLFGLFYVFVGIIHFVNQSDYKIVRRLTLVILILVNVFYSFDMSMRVKENGAGGVHLASYGAKEKILDYIYQRNSNPDIYFANVDSHGIYGWKYLLRYYKVNDAEPSLKFIVFEYKYWFRDIDEEELKKYINFEKHYFHKNVVLVEKK